MNTQLFYTIEIKNPSTHLINISLKIKQSSTEGQNFYFPTWIPGSYLIREFTKNIITLSAKDRNTKNINLKKIAKNIWYVPPYEGPLTINYQIYAFSWSVRTSIVDDELILLNGPSIFIAPEGLTHLATKIKIILPEKKQLSCWQIATTLRKNNNSTNKKYNLYYATNYDELLDHPIIAGNINLLEFNAYTTPHQVAIVGETNKLDEGRMLADLKKICEYQINFFEPKKNRPPFSNYLFIILLDKTGYGGLEHRSSSTLLCQRNCLPTKHASHNKDDYISFLNLCSHEYFHAWNVKRIKPIEFAPYEYNKENYTTLLWLFEGFTSYYEDLILVRIGLITQNEYFRKLTDTFAKVLNYTGRLKQTVAESSFDAWIKYYRPDENTLNATVSYYNKGAMIALLFDLTIRKESQGNKSLDDVMLNLWKKYGKSFYKERSIGITEKDFLESVKESTKINISTLFQLAVHSHKDLPIKELLQTFGLTFKKTRIGPSPYLGIKSETKKIGEKLTVVFDNSPAQKAGLSPEDTIIAIDLFEVGNGNLNQLLQQYQINDELLIHFFRRGVLRKKIIKLEKKPLYEYSIGVKEKNHQNHLRKAWLNAEK